MEILVIYFFLTIVIMIFQSVSPELSQHKPNTPTKHDASNSLDRIYGDSDDTHHVHHYLFY